MPVPNLDTVRPGHANKAVEAGVHTSFVHSSIKTSIDLHAILCWAQSVDLRDPWIPSSRRNPRIAQGTHERSMDFATCLAVLIHKSEIKV